MNFRYFFCDLCCSICKWYIQIWVTFRDAYLIFRKFIMDWSVYISCEFFNNYSYTFLCVKQSPFSNSFFLLDLICFHYKVPATFCTSNSAFWLLLIICCLHKWFWTSLEMLAILRIFHWMKIGCLVDYEVMFWSFGIKCIEFLC